MLALIDHFYTFCCLCFRHDFSVETNKYESKTLPQNNSLQAWKMESTFFSGMSNWSKISSFQALQARAIFLNEEICCTLECWIFLSSLGISELKLSQWKVKLCISCESAYLRAGGACTIFSRIYNSIWWVQPVMLQAGCFGFILIKIWRQNIRIEKHWNIDQTFFLLSDACCGGLQSCHVLCELPSKLIKIFELRGLKYLVFCDEK